MKKRAQKEERPQRKPFIRARIGDVEGEWVFRIPRRSDAIRLTEQINKAAPEDHSARESALGDLIASCWADEVHELEHTGGVDVYCELYDAGWSDASIDACVKGLADQARAYFTNAKEVAERTDFFSMTPTGENG